MGSYRVGGGRPSGTWRSRLELKESELKGALEVTSFTCGKTELMSFPQGHRACKCPVQLPS